MFLSCRFCWTCWVCWYEASLSYNTVKWVISAWFTSFHCSHAPNENIRQIAEPDGWWVPAQLSSSQDDCRVKITVESRLLSCQDYCLFKTTVSSRVLSALRLMPCIKINDSRQGKCLASRLTPHIKINPLMTRRAILTAHLHTSIAHSFKMRKSSFFYSLFFGILAPRSVVLSFVESLLHC